MNRVDRKYTIVLILIAIITITVRLLQPQPIDWSEGYAAREKKPFGAYILNNTLNVLFPEDEIIENNQPIYTIDDFIKNSNFIFINNTFSLDEFETEIILDRAEKGDYIFIAAREFSGFFADSLNLQVSYSIPFIDPETKSLKGLEQTGVNFTNPAIRSDSSWKFPNQLVESYFTSFDSSRTTILGQLGDVTPNYIRISYGRGALLIHSSPFLFTNYFLRDSEYYTYAYNALSYLPERTTIWDEYYKTGRLIYSTPIQYIVSERNLKIAWYLGIATLILFLVFGGKRLQRVIPEIKPVENTSIDFAATIGNMYLNNGSHQDILNKKITFFREYLRTNLMIDTTNFDEDVRNRISQRSGIESQQIHHLIDEIEQAQKSTIIDSKVLKRITDQIDNFYKNTQR